MTLSAPEGFQWVEVGAYSERTLEDGWKDRQVLVEPHDCGWWDGRPHGAVCRGGHPTEEPPGGWERMYVLRRAS